MAEVVMTPSETRFQSEQPSFCSRLVLRIQTSDCVHRPSVHRSFWGLFFRGSSGSSSEAPHGADALSWQNSTIQVAAANEQTSEMGATVQWKLANLWIWGFIDGKQLPDCLIRLATSLLLSTFLLGNCHRDTVSPSWDVVEHPLNRKKTICGACPAILRHTQNIVSAHQASGELLLCRLKERGRFFPKHEVATETNCSDSWFQVSSLVVMVATSCRAANFHNFFSTFCQPPQNCGTCSFKVTTSCPAPKRLRTGKTQQLSQQKTCTDGKRFSTKAQSSGPSKWRTQRYNNATQNTTHQSNHQAFTRLRWSTPPQHE